MRLFGTLVALVFAAGAITSAMAQDIIYKKGYVDGPFGQIHYHSAWPASGQGDKTPVVFFHQNPKSAEEYRPLVEPVGRSRLAIAFDTPGYGESERPNEPQDMVGLANAMADALEALGYGEDGKGKVDVFGFHTGVFIASELALQRPDLVRRVVMSGIAYRPQEYRDERLASLPEGKPLLEDGTFVLSRWHIIVNNRSEGVSLERASKIFLEDIHSLDKSWYAYKAVWTYAPEDRFPKLTQPVLVLQPHEMLTAETLRAREELMPEADLIEIPEITDDVFDTGGEEIAAALTEWLDNAQVKHILTVLALLLAPFAAEAEDVNVGGFIIPGSIAAGLFYDYEKRLVEESGGVLEPNLLIHGEGGPEEQILTGIRRGRIHVASLSTLVLSNIVPELAYLGAPFQFDSKEQFDHVVDTKFVEVFAPLLAERDLTILRWLDLGGQNIYANKPILWPRDAVGVRLRSTQDIASRMFLESVGADVIYITSPETIPGLQTGLIEGGLTPTVAYVGTGLVPDAPHYMLTQHFYLGGFFVANTRWLKGLPDNLRRIVTDTFASNAEIRAAMAQMITTALGMADEQNFTVHELTPEQRAAWREASAGTNSRIIAEIGGRTQDIADALGRAREAYLASRP